MCTRLSCRTSRITYITVAVRKQLTTLTPMHAFCNYHCMGVVKHVSICQCVYIHKSVTTSSLEFCLTLVLHGLWWRECVRPGMYVRMLNAAHRVDHQKVDGHFFSLLSFSALLCNIFDVKKCQERVSTSENRESFLCPILRVLLCLLSLYIDW